MIKTAIKLKMVEENFEAKKYIEDNEMYPIEEVMPPAIEKSEAEVGIIKELSPVKVLNQLRMELKGYYYDYDTEKWVKLREPLMNDKGIGKYLSIISSVVTDLVTFSSYAPEEINKLVQYVCEKAIPVIHINYKEFGIKDKADLQILDIQIFNLTKAAFHKAIGAGDRNVIRGTYGEQTMYRYGYPTPAPLPQQKSIFSKLNLFSRG